MSSLVPAPRPRLADAVGVFATFEYSRREVRRLGPELPAVLAAAAGIALGVALLRRLMPARLHPLIGVALAAVQASTVLHEDVGGNFHGEDRNLNGS